MSETTFLAAVLFLIVSLICGAIIQWGVSKVSAYKPPVSILWFSFGMLICAVEILFVPNRVNAISIDPQHPLGLLGIGIAEASRVHSSILFYIVLPILLYDATQQISWYHFSKNLRAGLLLAILGVVLQVVFIGSLMQWSFTQTALEETQYPSSVNSSTSALSNSTFPAELAMKMRSLLPPTLENLWLSHAQPQMTPADRQQQDVGHDQMDVGRRDAWELTSDLLEANLVGDEFGAFNKFSDTPQNGQKKSESILWLGPNVASDKMDRAWGFRDVKPSWSFSLMTASAVASTDPIAVLSILEELEAPPHFNSLFDCESLINDGSSIFLFSFFKSLTRGRSTSWNESVGRFATLLFVGPLFGFLMAALMYRWLKHFHFFPYDETLAVVFMSYLVFYLAEIYLRTSGPLAIVVYGLYFKYFAKAAFEPKTLEVHHHLVRGIALAATSVVFIISGIAAMRMIWDAFTSQAHLNLPQYLPEIEPEGVSSSIYGRQLGPGPPSGQGLSSMARMGSSPYLTTSELGASEIWRVPVFYSFLIVARFAMIGLFYPIIRKSLGVFTWREYLLLSWGGLRGAICLILGLLIEQDEHIPKILSSTAALYIASSAFLILIVNGLTFEYLFRFLNPYQPNPFKKIYLKKVMKFIDREYIKEISILQKHWLFENNWSLLCSDRFVPKLGKLEILPTGKIQLEMPPVRSSFLSLRESDLAKSLPTFCNEQKSNLSGIGHLNDFTREPADTAFAQYHHHNAGQYSRGANSPQNLHIDDGVALGGVPRGVPCQQENPSKHRKQKRDGDTDGDTDTLDLSRLNSSQENGVPHPVNKVTDDAVEYDLSKSPQLVGVGSMMPLTAEKDLEISMRPNQSGGSGTRKTAFGLGAVRSIVPPKKCAIPGLSRVDNSVPSEFGQADLETNGSRLKNYEWNALKKTEGKNQNQRTPTAAQVLQRLRQVPPQAFDVEQNLRVLENDENDFLQTGRDLRHSLTTPPTQLQLPQGRRIPGYSNDLICRIRSEPTGTNVLDVANVQNLGSLSSHSDESDSENFVSRNAHQMSRNGSALGQLALGEYQDSDLQREFDARSGRQSNHPINIKPLNTLIDLENPTTRRYDNNNGDTLHPGEWENYFHRPMIQRTVSMPFPTSLPTREPRLLNRHVKERESEVQIMVINTMRQLYKRMYDQAFISGTNYVALEAVADVVGDCALLSRKKNSRTSAEITRVAGTVKLSSGWELEWRLITQRLHRSSRKTKHVRRLLNQCSCNTCCPKTGPTSRLRDLNRRVWTSLWSVVGPRQIFPALDDLQLLTCFADVHEEMLVRGEHGLKSVLGSRLVTSFEDQIEKAKAEAFSLAEFYPDSFPIAIIAHGAIFLLNLKIQLVEEFFEKGLVLAEDKEKLCGFLKEQVLDVTKYHPPFLFT